MNLQSQSPNRLPRLSVLLCTYNRGKLLRDALTALCTQDLPRHAYEVVLIDDGSTDDTHKVADSFSGQLNLRYAYQVNSGLAAAKNHGLALARAPIVLFLDDDDVAAPDYLSQHLASHSQYPQATHAVLGFTDLLPKVRTSPLMRFVTQTRPYLLSYADLTDGDVLDFQFFLGGRTSCKKSLLMEHGMFNPAFHFGAEDIELGFRLSNAGLRVVYNRQAINHKARTIDFDEFCRRCTQQGQSYAVIGSLHPHDGVRDWPELHRVVCNWNLIKPRYASILASGALLHRYAVERANTGLPLDGINQRLLHRAYHAAFQASRIKGSAERIETPSDFNTSL